MVAPNDGNNMDCTKRPSSAANYSGGFNYLIATTTSHDFDHITTPYLAASTTRHQRRR